MLGLHSQAKAEDGLYKQQLFCFDSDLTPTVEGFAQRSEQQLWVHCAPYEQSHAAAIDSRTWSAKLLFRCRESLV
ncbi:hypothetical protein ABBQ38_011428 [Trebouxia sp. C0009 RCD-2024]